MRNASYYFYVCYKWYMPWGSLQTTSDVIGTPKEVENKIA